ncbi:MAG: ABC transporter substrate-binding protein [Anaerolineae bacterium]|nr:ABC transporter substrate-binding protein [Anaerolineae bacterium]
MLRTARRLSLLLLVFVILVVGFAPAAAQGDNVIHVVSLFDIRTADPHVAYEVETWTTVGLFYRGLVEMETTDTVAPALAESWTVSEDGLVYTFTLREGVKFSNGREITADDVKYSFERMFAPDFPSPTNFFFEAIAGAPEYRDGAASEISGVKAIDARTVEFTLSTPVWTFLQRLALPPGSIVAREGVEAAGDDFGRQPLGAGPFILDSWESGLRITTSRNPNYWKPDAPKVDGVVIDLLVDQSVGILRMDSGEADIAFDWVPSSEYPRISTDPALAERLITNVAFPNIDYLVFQHRNPPFDNKDVRRALSMAINRDRLVQLLNGRPVPATGPLPPDMPGNNADLTPFAYDPEGARAMLAAAGYADGLTTNILVNTDATNQQVVQAIVADWAQIGVTANVTVIDNAQFLDILVNQPETIEVVMTNWYHDYLDPSNTYEPLLQCGGSYNWGGYCSEATDAAFAEYNVIPPGADRWTAFAEFEALLFEEQPNAFLYHLQNYYYRSARLSIQADPAYLLKFDSATVQ